MSECSMGTGKSLIVIFEKMVVPTNFLVSHRTYSLPTSFSIRIFFFFSCFGWFSCLSVTKGNSLIRQVSSESGSLVRSTSDDFCFCFYLCIYFRVCCCCFIVISGNCEMCSPNKNFQSVDFSPTCWTSKQAFVEELLRRVQSTIQNQTQTWDERISNQNTSHQRCNLWRPSSTQSKNTGKPPQQKKTYVWEQERRSRRLN